MDSDASGTQCFGQQRECMEEGTQSYIHLMKLVFLGEFREMLKGDVQLLKNWKCLKNWKLD